MSCYLLFTFEQFHNLYCGIFKMVKGLCTVIYLSSDRLKAEVMHGENIYLINMIAGTMQLQFFFSVLSNMMESC